MTNLQQSLCSYCVCVCVGLSINEIINIMFYYSFISCLSLTSSIYLQMSLFPSIPSFTHFTILFITQTPKCLRIFHLLYIPSITPYPLNNFFLRWLVITIRYKIVFLLCLIMFEFLVELTKYNSI